MNQFFLCNCSQALFGPHLQVLPQLSNLISALKESLEYYEQLKLMEDMLKEKDMQVSL